MESQEFDWLLKEKYGGKKSKAFFADCRRVMAGEPLAYVIGWVDFLGAKIWLDSRPLIPRPETEYWVDIAIKTLKEGKTLPLGIGSRSLKILDLCAGSGCIGVAVAKSLPNARVDFSEIDKDNLPTIKKNLKENDISAERCQMVHSDLFRDLSGPYDIILSNPPYIDESLNRTTESVKKHEPYVALFGGQDGFEIIERIIKEAPSHLTTGGQLWLEHEPEQSTRIKELGEENGFSVTNHKDQYDVERYSILVLQ
jgi:release factor glutamine methyltransferase